MIDAALFDFSGTLFRLDYTQDSLVGMLGERAASIDADAKTRIEQLLTAPAATGIQGELTPGQQRDWQRRDLDPAAHERANIAVLRAAGVDENVAAQFYRGMLDPANWRPYPDTPAVLRLLREHGVRVGVVSNIAWDVRPCFARAGVEDLVAEYVFSYKEGVQKPSEAIFRTACERLDTDPARTLMVGDSATADGGATAVGCRFARVEALPVEQRPDGLLRAVRPELGAA